ncbi:MAG: hypothetical protein JWN08_2254 [Frankiales bacterium]|nr:hypothetical protein [Frankiales bacterium]
MSTDPAALLVRESRSLVQRLRLWTPVRYAAVPPRPTLHGLATRGDVVHHLAQALADRAAELEGRPSRPLPRLDSDLGLADQLAVTADDLVRCRPPADVAVTATAHLLLHRADLLDDEVPAGLAASLGLTDVLRTGADECERDRSDTLSPDG